MPRAAHTMKKTPDLPSTAYEVRELKAPKKVTSPSESEPESALTPAMQLKLCLKKVNNYRQSAAIIRLIDLCEDEPLTVKMNKVLVNINAMLSFARLDDEKLAGFVTRNIIDLYNEAFDHFNIDKAERIKLLETRNVTTQTTVEVNSFISDLISKNIEKINSLPEVISFRDAMIARNKIADPGPLYTATDIREYAILYYAPLSFEEKTRLHQEIHAEYGMLMTRLTEDQYKKKLQNLPQA